MKRKTILHLLCYKQLFVITSVLVVSKLNFDATNTYMMNFRF